MSRGTIRYASMDAVPPGLRKRMRTEVTGPQTYKSVSGTKRSPTQKRGDEEHEQQVEFFRRIQELAAQDPERYALAVRRTYAVPNGGFRHPRTAGRMRAEGAKPGVSDIECALPRGTFPGLYMEMKSRTGRASADQVDWLLESERLGYSAHLCCSADEALEVWLAYVDG